MISLWELVLRLSLATVLGGIIGFEREVNNRPAGFRTHILVTLGSCLIMILSKHGFIGFGFEGYGGEPARLAAQVVSGIGFLGAGTIMREGTNVRGLTTAASIWISGGIGLAVGCGFYIAALITTGLALFSLTVLQTAEKKIIQSKQYSEIRVQGIDRPGFIGDIGTVFGKYYINIKNISVENYSEGENEYEENIQITFYVRVPGTLHKSDICDELKVIQGVENIFWDDVRVVQKSKFYK